MVAEHGSLLPENVGAVCGCQVAIQVSHGIIRAGVVAGVVDDVPRCTLVLPLSTIAVLMCAPFELRLRECERAMRPDRLVIHLELSILSRRILSSTRSQRDKMQGAHYSSSPL